MKPSASTWGCLGAVGRGGASSFGMCCGLVGAEREDLRLAMMLEGVKVEDN